MHSINVMHRDLKTENILLSYVNYINLNRIFHRVKLSFVI